MNNLVSAINAIRNQIDGLPAQDKEYLSELLPILFLGSEEEQASAETTVLEIFEQKKGFIIPL